MQSPFIALGDCVNEIAQFLYWWTNYCNSAIFTLVDHHTVIVSFLHLGTYILLQCHFYIREPPYCNSTIFELKDRCTAMVPFQIGKRHTAIVPICIGEPTYYNSSFFTLGDRHTAIARQESAIFILYKHPNQRATFPHFAPPHQGHLQSLADQTKNGAYSAKRWQSRILWDSFVLFQRQATLTPAEAYWGTTILQQYHCALEDRHTAIAPVFHLFNLFVISIIISHHHHRHHHIQQQQNQFFSPMLNPPRSFNKVLALLGPLVTHGR